MREKRFRTGDSVCLRNEQGDGVQSQNWTKSRVAKGERGGGRADAQDLMAR